MRRSRRRRGLPSRPWSLFRCASPSWPRPDSRVGAAMRLAAVDIGSNTVHSLVADAVRGKLEDVAHYVEEPELGPSVARTGASGSRSKVAIQALRSVVERARGHGFEVLIAGATQAVRQATDRDAFVREASRAIGVPVHIIPANREAELSFLGVASRHSVRRGGAMGDLGGGGAE